MYSLANYGTMTTDSVRMDAYEAALRQTIQPGMIVLDIGAGSGIMSFLACQMGAGHVYAVEPDSAIQVAREIAAVNGFAERITCIQDVSTRVSLPQAADVIVSDLRGVLPLFRRHIPSLIDARVRLLKPGGVLIPQRDTLYAAVVHAPDSYADFTGAWDNNRYGLKLDAARRITINTWSKARIPPEQMLCPPQVWAVLDYTSIEQSDVRGSLHWTAGLDGLAHGLAIWFDAELIPGIGFSNAPAAPETIYGRAFFPWEQPVALAVGDTIEVSIAADMVGDEYIWRWQTQVTSPGGARKAAFKQSTFFGAPLALDRLQKRAETFAPALNKSGQIDRFILERMDGVTTLHLIAEQALTAFPAHFSDVADALAYVADLAERYGD